MKDNFDLRKFLAENRKPVNEIDADLLKRAQNTPAPKDASAQLAKRKASIDNQNTGTLQVSKGPNAEQEQKVIDIARDAIALMDEQPGTSAAEALKSVLEHHSGVNEYSDYEPGDIAPADLYFSDKHGKLVAMDDVDDKYHDSLEGWLVVKKGDKVPHPED